MSLVGPRPIIEAELERYAGDVDYYYMAKPGMVIPIFGALKSRGHAACAKRCFGV